jgi:6-phosphofructokinase 1
MLAHNIPRNIGDLGGKPKLNLAVIHVGAPCCGMNAAVRAFVRNCIILGHCPIGIQVNIGS